MSLPIIDTTYTNGIAAKIEPFKVVFSDKVLVTRLVIKKNDNLFNKLNLNYSLITDNKEEKFTGTASIIDEDYIYYKNNKDLFPFLYIADKLNISFLSPTQSGATHSN
jgi:hypothetical protein